MSTLFTDKFPADISTDEELQEIKRKYSHYDPYYVGAGCISHRRKIFDRLWERFEPYADANFLIEVKKQFHQRTWEMYLANVFLEHKFRISSDDRGPDIKIEFSGKTIWVECVACTKGNGNDSVPHMQYGVVQDLPEREMLLRITNSIDEKFKKYRWYLDKKIVGTDDIFIIALNRADLEHFDPGIPLALKALLGVGYLTFTIRPLSDKDNTRFRRPFWSEREYIEKKQGKGISVNFFKDQDHSGISAVIYSKNSILNHPEKIGDDCLLVHNPIATNPLDETIFSFFDQRKDMGDKIVKL